MVSNNALVGSEFKMGLCLRRAFDTEMADSMICALFWAVLSIFCECPFAYVPAAVGQNHILPRAPLQTSASCELPPIVCGLRCYQDS